MARPVLVPNIFGNEAGNQPATQLDVNFSNLKSVINDSASGWANAANDTGGANAYAVTLTPPPSGYVSGFLISMLPANSNTGASTININGLGSVSILNIPSSALLFPILMCIKTAGTTANAFFADSCVVDYQYATP
jgi:hypothetical protein